MSPGSDDRSAPGADAAVDVLAVPFDALPRGRVVRALGVDYGVVRPPGGGELLVTREGWAHVGRLLPDTWYAGKRYVREGRRLEASTGRVYRVAARGPGPGAFDLVVKFSRVAQDVPLVVETTFPEDVPPEVLAEARFNSPMEEFGLLHELRRGAFDPTRTTIPTQRPLAIWVPPDEYEPWELGRTASRLYTHNRILQQEQEDEVKAIELDIKRMYVLLYQWIKGSDAQECYEAGAIGRDEFRGLVPRVQHELHERGFRVLDNKPRHFILRRCRRSGRLLRDRDGRLVYGLVDFELLQRTREHHLRFKSRQHRRYWATRGIAQPRPVGHGQANSERVTIFGVDYLYGRMPDGGRLWVVGNDAELFDYFLPERWRRTPRVKLSPENEVYRTRTRDNIDLVYRRSRVGIRPRVDPLLGRGRAIREHGFNSPFEEVAVAERLRAMGIATTVPRAIFRTAHRAAKARYIEDDSRFVEHADVTTPPPEGEPVLTRDHDYYTLWDYNRGASPLATGEWGAAAAIDLDGAVEVGMLGREAAERIVRRTVRRIHAIGLRTDGLDAREIVVLTAADGAPLATPDGDVEIRLAIDALTAYDFGLLGDAAYRDLVEDTAERLRAVDCEGLDPGGSHLLLSMTPDGRFASDERGRVVATLTNFELIRGLYRPIR